MSWAIKIENLSKLYPLGGAAPPGTNLREDIGNFARRLFGRRPPLPANVPAAAADPSLRDAPANHFWALRDINIEIAQGEVIGIIGRNGAGKSTLLKILSRITQPTAGAVSYRGRMASLLEVGTGFHRELTGRENIFLNGSILGMRRAEIARKLDEIVVFAEIGKFLDTPVKFYSSGMYVRLAFAVAAHLETDILVVDEVLAVGDAQFQKKCLGKMEEVTNEQGRTILFVSHHLGAMRRLCTRGVLLQRGQTNGLTDMETAIRSCSAGGDEGTHDLDLGAIKRSHGFGEAAKFLRLRILGNNTLAYARPLRLQFTIECHRPINGLVFGIGFDSVEGSRVITLDSDNSHPPLNLLAGVHEFELGVDHLPLHPSLYTCGVGLVCGKELLDWLPGCATWEVQSNEHDVASHRGFAGCRLPITLRHLNPFPAELAPR